MELVSRECLDPFRHFSLPGFRRLFSPLANHIPILKKVLEHILFNLGSALGRVGVRPSDDAHEDRGSYHGRV